MGAAYRIEGEFQIRALRLDGRRVRIGWHRRKSDEWTVEATASAGVSVGTGEMDLFSTLVRAISADPKADIDELGRAGLSPDQATAILAAVQAAVSRRLELALAVEMSALESGGAAFLYEIDLPRLTPSSRDALDRALHGDLSALHRDTLPGVTCVRSIWTKASEKRISLDVNLLGIYNFGSIASLVRTGTVLAEPATGTLVFTDQITADRVRSAQVNYGADTSKLRHVLAESFLITAVYRGTEQAAGGLSLASSHTFFELRNNTSRQDMLRSLRIGTALGLWNEQAAGLPADAGDFGRTTVHARTDYDDALTTSLFLDAGGQPLSAGVLRECRASGAPTPGCRGRPGCRPPQAGHRRRPLAQDESFGTTRLRSVVSQPACASGGRHRRRLLDHRLVGRGHGRRKPASRGHAAVLPSEPDRLAAEPGIPGPAE